MLISHGLGGTCPVVRHRQGPRNGEVGTGLHGLRLHARGGPAKSSTPAVPSGNYGASEENLKRASKCLDILASLPEVDAKKLCAYGHSMGGFVTIGLAAKEPDRLVAAAISGSGIAPSRRLSCSVNAAADKVKTPFIIFHGSIDNTVRPRSRSVEGNPGQDGVANERHVFEGINHPVDREKAPEVFGLMRNWFAKYKLVEPGPVSRPHLGCWPRRRQDVAALQRREHRCGQPSAVTARMGSRTNRGQKFALQDVRQPDDRPRRQLFHLRAGRVRKIGRNAIRSCTGCTASAGRRRVFRLVERFDDAIDAGKMPPMLIVFVNGVRDSFLLRHHRRQGAGRDGHHQGPDSAHRRDLSHGRPPRRADHRRVSPWADSGGAPRVQVSRPVSAPSR